MTAVGRFHPASAPGGNRQPPGGRDQASNLVIIAINLLRDAGGGGRTLTRQKRLSELGEEFLGDGTDAVADAVALRFNYGNPTKTKQQTRFGLGDSRGDGGGAT